jgi:hypothetical protein
MVALDLIQPDFERAFRQVKEAFSLGAMPGKRSAS